MPHDARRVSEVRDWLLKSREDLDAARVLLDAPGGFPQIAVFHVQQAAEKALKGFLSWHDVPFKKTHDLDEIGRACIVVNPSLKDVAEQAVALTPFAWRFRYPGAPLRPTMEEATKALAVARLAYDAVLALLPDEARP